MNNHFELSDEEFLKAFKDCSLPPTLFNHEAHLRLAWIHLTEKGLEAGIKAVCHQVTTYVNHLEAQSKYHVTLTIAAVWIVNHFRQSAKSDNFFDFILEFPQLKRDFKGLIGSHYSFNIFDSESARLHYLEPDLMPFEY